MTGFDEAYKNLLMWTRTLYNTIEGSEEEIRKTLFTDSPLPDNCPSLASMAELIFRKIYDRIEEVKGCAKDLSQ